MVYHVPEFVLKSVRNDERIIHRYFNDVATIAKHLLQFVRPTVDQCCEIDLIGAYDRTINMTMI